MTESSPRGVITPAGSTARWPTAPSAGSALASTRPPGKPSAPAPGTRSSNRDRSSTPPGPIMNEPIDRVEQNLKRELDSWKTLSLKVVEEWDTPEGGPEGKLVLGICRNQERRTVVQDRDHGQELAGRSTTGPSATARDAGSWTTRRGANSRRSSSGRPARRSRRRWGAEPETLVADVRRPGNRFTRRSGTRSGSAKPR